MDAEREEDSVPKEKALWLVLCGVRENDSLHHQPVFATCTLRIQNFLTRHLDQFTKDIPEAPE